MATTIKIKRSTGSTAPTSLNAGELAYTGGSGTYSNGGSRLYVGNPADGANLVIGGKYFADALDHAPGTLTADSAIIVDSSSKIDQLKLGNTVLTGSTDTISTTAGSLTIAPTGNLVITHGGTVDLSGQANSVTIPDNQAAAFDINEGGTSYITLVTTNLGEKVVIGQDATFADDVSLISDGAVLNFGLDSDVNLTHVADTGLLLNAAMEIQFRDSALTIGSSTNGQLDIEADVELEITAPTVEFNTDAQVVAFGADGDVTLTHVADTGLLLNAASEFQFRDSTLTIGSTLDGQLDIDADGELEITAPIVDINASTSVNISNDLNLDSDAAVVAFGADGEITLTHVADTGLLLNSGSELQFRDSALNINSSVDGQLDIEADTKLEITSPTVSLNTNSQVLAFGSTSDVTLTHVNGTGLLLNSGNAIQFRDSALAINSSVDGQLDIIADTQLEITAPTVEFNTDAQVLAFGADGDVTLTHVADTGLLLNGSSQIQFRDSALNISSTSDGTLAIAADTEVDITTTTLDINGAVDISGNTQIGGTLDVNGQATLASLNVEDLTSTRVVFAGTSGELVDNGNFTFTTASSTLNLTGQLNVDNVRVDGNTISTTNTDGDLTLSPNGNGVVKVPSGYDARSNWDSNTLVTKSYVDSVKQALDIKDSVRVATTAELNATYNNSGGTLTNAGSNAAISIDGVTLSSGDRVLVKNQTTGSTGFENGIYSVTTVGDGSTAWVLTRTDDANASSDVTSGMFCWVEEGTDNADQGYVLTTNDTITLGTTELTFTQFSGLGQIIAGDGLTKTANTIDVVVDDVTLAVSANQVNLKGNVTTTAAGDLLYGLTANGGYDRLALGTYDTTHSVGQMLQVGPSNTIRWTNTLDGGTF